MNTDSNFHKMKRRNFVKNAALGTLMPSFFGKYDVSAVGASSSWLELLNNTETDHVLVLIQMSGGNDGLNMVIPLDQYANLAAARSNVLINETQVLALNGNTVTGLHPAMTGMRDLYNEGKLKIVHSVGYPSPNFSHFRATDIWMSASNSNELVNSGWMGRYLQSEYANYPAGYPNTTMPDPLALQIGNQLSLTFQGSAYGMGVTISSATDFYNFVNNVNDPAPNTKAGNELSFIRTVARQSQQYGDVVKNAYTRGANLVTYPTQNTLADQLKIVARLIKGGLKTRVYMVNIGGFDTHAMQVDSADKTKGTHATLLQRLSEGITAFQRDLEALRIQDRVLGMTFSEFGRRIKSNFSVGTDHGAAAPLFVFGTRLHGGILGQNPTIAANVDVNANIPMLHDFRSVYASILKDWFCVPDAQLQTVMLRNHQPLRIVNSPNCVTSTHEQNVAAGQKLISNYPNPFDSATNIEFQTLGGYTLVQVFDVQGQLIAIPVEGDYAEGKYKVYFNAENLPAGVYYARFQNGVMSQVKTMVKVR
jgi:uncharacterized protein (DUF1501 family)